jgi:ech hydrogenase subunit A
MNSIVLGLIILPWVASAILLVAGKKASRVLTTGTMLALSALSFVLLLRVSEPIKFALPEEANKVVAGLDFALLAFFIYLAIRYKSWLVGTLSILQLGLLIPLLGMLPMEHGEQFYVDKLSIFMYLLINVVSGIICVYALKYIEDEDVSPQKRRNFMATLLWFVGVMNFIVSVDNLEWFFLLFELTTLASFILIKFREDPTSHQNAVRALWMNQIGGVAILVALIIFSQTAGYQSIYLSKLVPKAGEVNLLLPFALIAIAAMIKGAQMPFSGWLMGAMVAPTPVSALLHSSTMVKIAPFLMLRLAPALHGTRVAHVIILSCSFVFVVAALGSLAKDNFKLILAQSTIALLALMIMLATIGTAPATLACLFLVLFHGLSKSLLFLNAGILEKVFHIKSTSHIQQLGEAGPFTSFTTSIGFLSLMLPPFGAFIGKWLGVEALASANGSIERVISVLVIATVAIGSAILSFLYLKVIGSMVMRRGSVEEMRSEKMPLLYRFAPITLVVLLGLGMVGIVPLSVYLFAPVIQTVVSGSVPVMTDGLDLIVGTTRLPFIPITGAILLLPVLILIAQFIKFKQVDRVKEYTCGEKAEMEFSSYYFSFEKFNPYFIGIGTLFFVSIVLLGRVSF